MLSCNKVILFFVFLFFASSLQARRDVALWTQIRDMGIAYQNGTADSAYSTAQALLATAENNNDALAQAVLHNFIGICLDDRKDTPGARDAYTRCAEISARSNLLEKSRKNHLPIYFQTMLNAYARLVLIHNAHGHNRRALNYAQTGMQWVAECREQSSRVPALTVFADELMAHHQYSLIYEPMKHGVQDALQLGQNDMALLMTAYIIDIEHTQMHRKLEDIPWVSVGKDLLPNARTETSRTAFLSAINPPNDKTDTTDEPAHGLALQDSSQNTLQMDNPSPNPPAPAPVSPSVKYIMAGNGRIRMVVVVLVVIILFSVAIVIWLWRKRHNEILNAEKEKSNSYREGQENERGRLARELHDGMSNQLLAIEMKLKQEGATPQTLQLLAQSREQVRRVSHELIPPEFENTTLSDILSNYCSELNGTNQCGVSFFSSPARADWAIIPPVKALEIYRIVQELVGNTLKHSDASQIAVGIQKKGQTLLVIVSDNATTSIAESPNTLGIGKQTVKQRTSAIDGSIEVFHHQSGNVFRLSVILQDISK